jgi:HK97 family phage major capsid protein
LLATTGLLTATGAPAALQYENILGAIATLSNAGAAPSGVVMSWSDWAAVAAHKGTDTFPFAGLTPDSYFGGIPVVITAGIAAGTALVGDFARSSAWARAGEIRIDTGIVNRSFVENKRVLRAESRVLAYLSQPWAFRKVVTS